MEIDMGIRGLKFGSGVTRFPDLVDTPQGSFVKLDGVGPVDNRPATLWLHNLKKKKYL